MNEFTLSLIAGAGFSIASLLGLAGFTVSRALRALSISIAAGVLLAVAFVELFPEALEAAGHERAAVGFLVGFAVLFLVEIATKGHTHHHGDEPCAHDHDHAHDAHAEDHVAPHKLWPFIIGLSIHNFADGFTIGASTALSHEAASAVTIGVLIHQLPVGVSFAAVLGASHAGRAFLTRSAIALGAAIPLGALCVMLLPNMTQAGVATLAAVAAGALTYIAASHLLPEAHAERVETGATIAFPLVLAATTWLFLSVLGH